MKYICFILIIGMSVIAVPFSYGLQKLLSFFSPASSVSSKKVLLNSVFQFNKHRLCPFGYQ